MKPLTSLLTGAGLGAGVMYYVDPNNGRRRRVMVRDQVTHLEHKAPEQINLGSRDLTHRVQGIFAKTRSLFRSDETLLDDVLIARIRAKLGRYVSHPHAIDIGVQNGKVTLRGDILHHEYRRALRAVSKVRGVQELDDQLEVRKHHANLPSLQGGRPRLGERLDVFQTNWAPATRLIMTSFGVFGGLYGLRRGGIPGLIAGTIGTTAVLRSILNRELKNIFGFGRNSVLTFHKTMHISAPVSEVYNFWSNFENFPKFMREILSVERTGDLVSRWVIHGPLSAPVSWDSVITRHEPYHVIAWKSVPGALIRNAGRVQFFEDREGGTKIELEFSYHPPIGVLGHTVAKIFGSDPKARIDSCLMQMKQLIEQGPSPRQLHAI